MATPWKIRKPYPSDIDFIVDTWTKNYRERGKLCPYIVEGLYYAEHSRLVRLAIVKDSTLVACDPEDDTIVYGWIVGRPGTVDVLHYIYVRRPFRRSGVAKALLIHFLEGEVAQNTHENVPRYMIDMLKRSYKSLTFNPYLFYSGGS